MLSRVAFLVCSFSFYWLPDTSEDFLIYLCLLGFFITSAQSVVYIDVFGITIIKYEFIGLQTIFRLIIRQQRKSNRSILPLYSVMLSYEVTVSSYLGSTLFLKVLCSYLGSFQIAGNARCLIAVYLFSDCESHKRGNFSAACCFMIPISVLEQKDHQRLCFICSENLFRITFLIIACTFF